MVIVKAKKTQTPHFSYSNNRQPYAQGRTYFNSLRALLPRRALFNVLHLGTNDCFV